MMNWCIPRLTPTQGKVFVYIIVLWDSGINFEAPFMQNGDFGY